MLRFNQLVVNLAALSITAVILVLPSSVQAQSEDVIRWDDVSIRITDERNVCNVEGGTKLFDNPFDTFSPRAWRDKVRTDCWYPVFHEASDYFIKVFDWGKRPTSITCAEGGCGSTPIDIWVMGWHAEDRAVKYRRSLTLYRIRCVSGANRIAPVRRISYRADGSMLADQLIGSGALKAAVPETKDEAFARAICG